jgi:hypothetical protein
MVINDVCEVIRRVAVTLQEHKVVERVECNGDVAVNEIGNGDCRLPIADCRFLNIEADDVRLGRINVRALAATAIVLRWLLCGGLCVTEFLESGTEYKLEVQAIEASGNQTLTETTFLVS